METEELTRLVDEIYKVSNQGPIWYGYRIDDDIRG